MHAGNGKHAQIMAPPPLVFLGYLLGALVLNWAVPFALPGLPAARLVGGILALGGLLLAGAAVWQMRRAHTAVDPRQPVSALVMQGPYHFTRNPIYLGFLLIYLGFTFVAGTWWGLLLGPVLLWTITQAAIRPEEIYLEEKFKDAYRSYRAAVRRWL